MRVLILFLVLLLNTSILLAPIGRSDRIKIFVVLSYYPGHICSTPQLKGFIKGIQEISRTVYKIGGERRLFQFQIRYDYLRSIKQNVTEYQKQRKARIIREKIHYFKPDFIVTIDDNAFQYVAIPESRKYSTFILFTGLNEPLKKYKETFGIDTKMIYGVEESINLSKFFKLLKNSSFTLINAYFIQPQVNTMLNTERYILQNILRQFMIEKGFRIYQKEISNYEDLVQTIKDLQNDPIGIIVPIVQKTEDLKGRIISNHEIMCTIYNYNKKHLVIGFNPEFCKYGCPITCSINFFKSGYTLAMNILQNILLGKTKDLKHVHKIPTQITVNRKIIKEMGFERLVQNSLIDKYVTGIQCKN